MHGTRRQKDNLLVEVEKVLVAGSVPGFNWSSKYGLLAETRGGPAYEALSGKVYAQPDNEEPPEIYPYTRTKWASGKKEKMNLEWNMFKTACFTRFGALDAICENIRHALPPKCYEQLENELMGYKDVPIHAYFDHLDKRWCRMDTKTRKKMRAEFYEPWNQVVHISKFGKHLTKEQKYLRTFGIEIDDEAKIQFYVE